MDTEPDATVLCVTGSPQPDLFAPPPGVDFLRLPGLTKDRSGAYVPRQLSLSTSDVVRMRASLIQTVARDYRPDVIVVDHTPTGVGGELLPMLEEQRRSGRARLVLGMRDVVDEPFAARRELARDQTRYALEQLYDRVVVYGHPHICDVSLEYGLGSAISHKLRYVGVACTPLTPSASDTGSDQITVCVGGGEDGRPTMEAVLDWLASDAAAATRATMVTGPLMSRSDRDSITRRAYDLGVRIMARAANLTGLFRASGTIVGMGGYNTVYESLALRKRVVVIPRIHPRREQWDRARRLRDLDLLELVEPDDLDKPGVIGEAVQVAEDRAPIDPADVGLRFDGARVAAMSLLREASGHRLALAS